MEIHLDSVSQTSLKKRFSEKSLINKISLSETTKRCHLQNPNLQSELINDLISYTDQRPRHTEIYSEDGV